MSLAATIRAMASAGCTVEQIAADGYERWVHTKSWMDDLTVETVLAAARDLLKAKQ